MICKKCGSNVSESDVFCGNCGEKVEKTLPVEKVKYVLYSTKKEGLLKQIICYIIFYEKEIVFAHLSKERQKIEYKLNNEKLKSEGANFFSKIGSNINFFENYGQKYYEMPKEVILSEEINNFSIKYDQIKKVKFTKPKLVYYKDSDVKEDIGKLVIILNDKKLKFTHKDNDSKNMMKSTFKQHGLSF
jgi:hypothetical protein